MAKLKLRLPNLDDVPEALRDYYRELEDGTFMIDHEADPDGYGVDNLAKMRHQLDEARRKKTSVEGKLLKKEDGSLYTTEEIEAITSQLTDANKLIETLKDKDQSGEEKFARRLQEAVKPLQEKLTRAEQRSEVYRSKVHDAATDQVVDRIVKQLNPLPEWEGLLRSELRRHVKVNESDDGTIQESIVDPTSGEVRYSSLTGVDGPMGWEEFAKDKALTDKYGKCLRGDGKEGAGPIGGQTPPRGAAQKGRDVVLPKDYTSEQFEAAFEKATQMGGEVVFAEDGA